VRVRKQDQKEQDENQSLLDTYLRAIATATPPLAKAA
ncbi:MAG TPA: GapR family DNA-binding domain-containing protein, partial [Beijerinckiaceae bacterium]|nr:GapR family DNA-binding domain-containing protein [Beijerinckiaceae bacterium]